MIAATVARLAVALALLHAPALAARPLTQFQHRAFTSADGAPDDVFSIAQDPDGMLWLGAATGIHTFDGQRFTRYPIDFSGGPRQPYYLYSDRKGGIWIGWLGGGITVIRKNGVQHFDKAAGIPDGSVWGFDVDRDGAVWAAGMHGIARFDGRRWQHMGAPEGFDAKHAAAVSVDPGGNVGVFTEKGIYVMPKGARRFDPPAGTTPTRQPLAIGPEGRMYFMDQAGIRRIASLPRYDRRDFPDLYRHSGETTGSFLAARDGSLWFDSDTALHRIAHPEREAPLRGDLRTDTETLDYRSGRSGKIISAIVEDDRGDVWTATPGGLDRYRPTALVDVTPAIGTQLVSPNVFAATQDGGMWLQTSFPRRAWFRLDAAGRIVERYHGAMRDMAVPDGDGVVTIDEISRRLVVLRGGSRQLFGPPLPDARVNLLARAADGRFWVALMNGQVLRGDGTAWTPVAGLPTERATTIRAEPDGVVWLGYLDNRLARIAGDGVTVYGAAQGLSTGSVAGIMRVGTTLWVAGARGLNLLRAGRFTPVPTETGMFDDLAGAIADRRGGMWLSGRAGLMYLSAAQLAGCVPACRSAVTPALFDHADGLAGRSSGRGLGYMAQDTRGRIWVATGTAVYRVDDAPATACPAPPHALVTAATAAGQRHNTGKPLVLGAGTSELQLDYTAPVPDTPERVRFRYRLAGYDGAWHDAGARRQAFYTGLAPGRYRFEVCAAHANSAWSTPAALAIEILPAWYQTWWLRGAAGGALVAALALAYRARVRRLTRRVREQEEARQHERERIARELHDTVLQTNFALLLQVRAVAQGAAGNPLAPALSAIVDRAQASIVESRAKIAGLRAEQDAAPGFAATLEHLAAAILQGSAVALTCTVRGKPWPLSDSVAPECRAIVAEAVTNMCRHAQATTLTLAVRYGLRACTISVTDNGRGIPQAYLGGRMGHWGLAGMRERAGLIHARLTIDTGAGGTTVRLRVPRRKS
jgi:signal transduction histidine kinase/ligand-binding sensor domain-containing protein